MTPGHPVGGGGRRPSPGRKPSPRSKLSPGRTLAASILRQVDSGRRLDVAWDTSGAPHSPERGWIRTLTYGTVRLRGRLDHLLTHLSGRPLGDLDPEVVLALRMGAYQILAMGGVPAYAAVSESVEQVKGTRSRAAAGLVNAVLRKVARTGWARSSFPHPETDLEGHLTTWGSHPSWMVRRWIAAFGAKGARALVEANNQEPAIYLRPVGLDANEAEEILAAAGLGERGSSVHGCVRLASGTDPGAALAQVPGVIQDPAASLVVEHVSPNADALIADLCAAPGGKTLALSAAVGGVVAADLSARRLDRLAAGAAAARRWHTPVWPVVADARRPPLRSADVVLVDVPCSGTGTLRRHPDGRWRVIERDIARLANLQRSILAGAASAVSHGGLLVYATCALEHEENGGQVKDFLERNPGFRIAAGPAPDRFLDDMGCLSVLPHQSGFDGAFAARLRRVRD